ncbi:molybdopterin-guanine dinucleotide biosynthesis [Fictibacillus macauensis ZFHKF-1]|uniref:Probable molybdenum cofactor guanylyltransferase n=1 Tax=Fictibacillus macauensis ZFHKF-1 TaxID=1196324 RepID=I8J099_9BACL|nr:molybdenum cofactor guanylyltransferase [Fictibacillus macauensis]EIT85166.1 molybdopterin-guanine dinucleotide biosynthesis [Fictibacillus macauensis ZFHKF-1]
MDAAITGGIILAGGSSRRFGEHKAFAQYKERYFYEIAVSVVQEVAEQCVVVAYHRIASQLSTNVSVIQDRQEVMGQGPLAGLYSGMNAIGVEGWFAVITCDTPFMTADVYYRLLHMAQQEPDGDAIVPVSAGVIQPLTALYHRRILPQLMQLLNEGKRSVRALLEQIAVKFVTEDDASLFVNINTKEDYEKYVK